MTLLEAVVSVVRGEHGAALGVTRTGGAGQHLAQDHIVAGIRFASVARRDLVHLAAGAAPAVGAHARP